MTSYTTYALNTRDFYPALGEIRIVGPGKTREYPYQLCKKALFADKKPGVFIRAEAFIRINMVCKLFLFKSTIRWGVLFPNTF